MTDARLCHPVRVSPPRCAPERCLRHDGRAVLSFGSGRSRVARPQRDSYGMTEQYVLSPRRGLSALLQPQRDAYGMTGQPALSPWKGLSAASTPECQWHDRRAPPLIHPLTSTLLLPYRDIARTHKPHPRVDGYRIRIGVDAHRQIRAQRHRSAYQCRRIAPAAKAR